MSAYFSPIIHQTEFRAVASTTTEVLWMISLLSELGFTFTIKPNIYCDNLSATHYCANPVFHSKRKNLALDFHFVRGKVQDGSICVTNIKGDDQLADTLKKPLLKHILYTLISKIGLLSRSSILREHINT